MCLSSWCYRCHCKGQPYHNLCIARTVCQVECIAPLHSIRSDPIQSSVNSNTQCFSHYQNRKFTSTHLRSMLCMLCMMHGMALCSSSSSNGTTRWKEANTRENLLTQFMCVRMKIIFSLLRIHFFLLPTFHIAVLVEQGSQSPCAPKIKQPKWAYRTDCFLIYVMYSRHFGNHSSGSVEQEK